MSSQHDSRWATGRSTDRTQERPRITADQRPTGADCRHERLSSRSATSPRSSGAAAPERVVLTQSSNDRHRGPGIRGLQDLLARLSARDISLLDLLAEHRFLTTHHLQAFCFHDHSTHASAARTARRVLTRLARESLVERMARRVGGMRAGSDAHVWRITSVGQRLRALRIGTGSSVRVRTPSARFVEHYLAVADVRLQIVDAERRGLLSISRVQIEPICWQSYTGRGGNRETLKPDLAAVTTPSEAREYEDHWYIEVDRATESIPTVLKQCHAYEDCRRSGLVQDERGVFPLIVWVVPTERRATNVRNGIRRAHGMDIEHYRVCTPDQLLPLLLGGSA